jgi:hypothetical protein
MTKKRWTTQQLKEILGEPYTVGPRAVSTAALAPKDTLDWDTPSTLDYLERQQWEGHRHAAYSEPREQTFLSRARFAKGESYTIRPRGHTEPRERSEPRVQVNFSARVVKVGTKELKPGEQIGWMQWNCAGGDALEQNRKEKESIRAAHVQAAQKGQLAGPISPSGGYLSCIACVHDYPNLWVMQRVCRKHYPILGEGSD